MNLSVIRNTVIISICIFQSISSKLVLAQDDSPTALNGVIDVRQYDLNQAPLKLSGEWFFYESQLVARHNPEKGKLATLQELWPSEIDYGSYSMLIVAGKGRELSISIPQVYCSYQLSIDSKLIGSNGKVGSSPEQSEPQWRPQTVSFTATTDTVELVLAISNFYHHKGGIKEALLLGSPELLLDYHRTARVGNLVEAFTLLAIAIGFFILYFTRWRKKIVVYFALVCASWAIRSLFSNQYLFIQYVPDFNWYAMIRIEYLTLYLTMTWGVLFLSRLFVKESNLIVKYLLVAANCVFIGFTLFAAPLLFTQWLSVYLVVAMITLVYSVIVVLRALVNEQIGAWWLTLSILLATAVFGYDIAAFKGVVPYHTLVLSTGYILIFLSMGFALLYFLNLIKGKSKTSSMMRYEDFFGKD